MTLYKNLIGGPFSSRDKFLSPRSCNFKIARVNHSAISVRFSAISRRFLTKLNHKDPSGGFFAQDFSLFLYGYG